MLRHEKVTLWAVLVCGVATCHTIYVFILSVVEMVAQGYFQKLMYLQHSSLEPFNK